MPTGLGTSTSKEAKEYFSNMQRHRVKFRYEGNNDDQNIVLAFSKKKIEERKDWLTKWMNVRFTNYSHSKNIYKLPID